MAKAVEKNPVSDTPSESDPKIMQMLDEFMGDVSAKIAELQRKQEVITTHLGGGEIQTENGVQSVNGFWNDLQNFGERLGELENLAAQLETGPEIMPATLLADLTPAKLFLTCVQSLMLATVQTMPMALLDKKPQNRSTHLRNILEVSYQTVLMARERSPQWKSQFASDDE